MKRNLTHVRYPGLKLWEKRAPISPISGLFCSEFRTILEVQTGFRFCWEHIFPPMSFFFKSEKEELRTNETAPVCIWATSLHHKCGGENESYRSDSEEDDRDGERLHMSVIWPWTSAHLLSWQTGDIKTWRQCEQQRREREGKGGRREGGLTEGDRVTESGERGSLHEEKREGKERKSKGYMWLLEVAIELWSETE